MPAKRIFISVKGLNTDACKTDICIRERVEYRRLQNAYMYL